MSARMQQGQRPGGSRFAQFKLVLLGESAVGKVRTSIKAAIVEANMTIVVSGIALR
ncbi:Ras-domain-containing protein [Pyrenophora tritici-repentis]|nr:Ras-domain-containing protein [Pyrenophora tritici-repentis]KAI1532390.1 hypothetical protein PtrSN001A_007299 [Pyrenophora tritici-repentis]KAI1553069.1 hypothetical protein PtrSN001C_000376 [Pyrenophora tritici-repentis]KAI1566725.1 hypothetical protein PtrEW4_007488 [Pyrenophora tritici-repentis]KAI1588739.1 hypothetical protein PtrEW7m1_000417 [Pyrenophora tritici-repentis]